MIAASGFLQWKAADEELCSSLSFVQREIERDCQSVKNMSKYVKGVNFVSRFMEICLEGTVAKGDRGEGVIQCINKPLPVIPLPQRPIRLPRSQRRASKKKKKILDKKRKDANSDDTELPNKKTKLQSLQSEEWIRLQSN